MDYLTFGIAIITTIVVVTCSCHVIYTNYYTIYPEVNWSNGDGILAKDILPYEIKNRGTPTQIDRAYQGYALWDEYNLRASGSPYVKIILRDKSQAIDKPYRHIPLLEYHLHVEPDERLIKLARASMLLSYDSHNNHLVACSDSPSINQHILFIAHKLIRGEMETEKAINAIASLEYEKIRDDHSAGFSCERLIQKG